MKTIWNWTLLTVDSQAVLLPQGAKFLSVIEQDGRPVLYALVDPKAPMETTEVRVKGTGEAVDEAFFQSHVFLGTVKIYKFSWHIFVERR